MRASSQVAAGRGPNEELIGRPGSRALLSTPALVLDLDALEANVASLAAHARAHGYALRPPMKIHKSVEIARGQVEAGALGLCCATLAEAEALVAAGIPGTMLFSTVVTPAKLDRLAALCGRGGDLLVVTDGADNVAQLAAAARRGGGTLRVLVDYEVGGGRTGIADPDEAVALARLVAGTDGLEYAGVQGYAGGHQSIVDYDERRRASLACLARLGALVERLAAEGLEPPIVTGGGTGSHDVDHEAGVLTELQAGTYAVMDVHYRDVVLRRDEAHPFAPALSVRTSVIGAAQPGFVMTDAGTKEVDGMLGPLAPALLRGAPAGARYRIVGDDLGRVDLPAGARLAVGDAVEIQPPHCYQTIPMYPVYHCVRGDTLVEVWPVDARESW